MEFYNEKMGIKKVGGNFSPMAKKGPHSLT